MIASTHRTCLLAVALAMAAAACPGDPSDVDVDAVQDADGAHEILSPAPDSTDAGDTSEPVTWPPSTCDPLTPSQCALPWPSGLYLAPNPSRVTGVTLRFGATSLPATTDGIHVDPTPWERLDGYGVGTPLIVHFPGLDVSTLASEDAVERSMEADAPIVWLQVDPVTGEAERVPYWAELDAHANGPEDQVLFVRPGVLMKEAAQQVVAFRTLMDTDGAPVPPSDAFRALRDGTAAKTPELAPRVERFEAAFGVLEANGVARDALTLAR